MAQSTVLVPLTPNVALEKFGKGDKEKLKSYLLMMAAFLEGRPENTRRAYRMSLRTFFDLFDWICPEDVTVAHAAAFKKWLVERKKYADATAYARMSGVSSFFDFLCQPPTASAAPLIQSNPFKAIPRHDIKPTPYGRAEAMEWATFTKIVNALPTDEMGLRDRAILLFLAYTGRRRMEVCRLRVKDLRIKTEPRKYTTKVKGGEVKTFALPERVWEAIRDYWTIAGRFKTMTPESGVFTPVNTRLHSNRDPERPLSYRALNCILARAAVRADVKDEPGVHVHGLRHMMARDLNEAGVRMQDIQAALGHGSIATTQIYTNHLAGPPKTHETALDEIRKAAATLARAAAS